ncbi:unnamed protein product [Chilo suppressalis]|uniref:MADF domain-containing protein n=1 Tax=Chilo suppressalis TaxID=168631 RepID=A0ABN8L7X3_CHISP|nr:unnamed protein product [Chilo suppressalis]
MSKPIKSSVRSLLYSMINKYEQRKTDTSRRVEEKIRLLDKIVSSASMSDDEDIKRKIKDLVKELKDIENKDLITSESSYLTHWSNLTDVSVNTMRRIKKEGSG